MIKQCIRSPQNEPNALRQVEQYASIPAPRVVDVGEYDGDTYLVMTRLPGQPLIDVFYLMSYAERNRLADDLRTAVTQLRKIPNKTPFSFGDTLGGPLVDHCMPNGTAGPFNSEADFYNRLTSHMSCTIADVIDGPAVRFNH
jgi:hypothetical protein